MKFKAIMDSKTVTDSAGPVGAKQTMMLHVLQAMQRLERASEGRKTAERRGAPPSIVIKLTREGVAFCHRGGGDGDSQTWSHFQVDKFFNEYRIESKRDHRIDLEAPIANLVHVFHGCASSDKVTIRLANGRDGRPILAFEFSITGNITDHRVDQEVPVRVIPEDEAKSIAEPSLPEPEYQIELPDKLDKYRNVLDKMRAVGAHHLVAASAQEPITPDAAQELAVGSHSRPRKVWLRLSADAELVSIESTFPHLELVSQGKRNPSPEGPVTLVLSLRRLCEVLAAFEKVATARHIACVIEGRALVLYALLPSESGSVISYTPAVTD